jgi:hypothetical protein
MVDEGLANNDFIFIAVREVLILAPVSKIRSFLKY